MRKNIISLIAATLLPLVPMIPCTAQPPQSSMLVPIRTWATQAAYNSLINWREHSTGLSTNYHQPSLNSSSAWFNVNNAARIWSGALSGSSNNLSNNGLPRQINLDLSSISQSARAGRLLSDQTVNIAIGGKQLAVNATTPLTTAEKAAVMQVLRTGQQSLLLDALGRADGGTLVIGSRLGQALSGLVVPKGVTVVDISRSGNLNISGDVTDAGSLFLTSRNPEISSVRLAANNITVESGGLLSSIVPAGIVLSTNTATNKLNLNLTATNNITNGGTITSNGALTVTAGGSISNGTLVHTATTGAVMQALGNVNLLSASGAISNSGLITSTAGNINMSSTALTNDFNIVGTGGVWRALKGAINVQSCLDCSGVNVNLTGGKYLSQQLNLASGNGNLNVNIQQATGTVNSSAHDVDIQVSTGQLTLGTVSASGDPTVVDFSSAGIDLAGTPSVHGNPYIIVSGGTISSSVAGLSIDTSANGSTSDNIVLIAGATGSWAGGSNPVIITGPSAAGGNIDLTNVATLSSAGTSGALAGFGGNITLVAFARGGRGSTVGKVIMPSSLNIEAGGFDNLPQLGTNGNVTIVAGIRSGLSAAGIIVGAISTSSAIGAGGIVTITSATPVVGSGIQINPANGNISGSFLGNAPLYTAVALNGALTAGGPVTVATGGNITAGSSESISSPTIILWSARGGVGTLAAPVFLNSATTLSASAASSVYIKNLAAVADVTLTTGTASDGSVISNSASGTYSLDSKGQVRILSNVTAGQQINLSASGAITSIENVVAQISAGQLPTASVINTAGTLLYVVDAGLNQLIVINTKTNLIVAMRPVGITPSSVALSPNGSIVYVSNLGSNTISSFDTATLTSRPSISVPGPTVMALNTDGSMLYVASATTNTVSEINTKTNAVVGTINPGGAPQSVSFDNANGFVYIAVSSPDEILGINPLTGAQVSISLPHSPTSIGQCPCGTKLFVSSAVSDSIYIVSLETNSLVSTITLAPGSSPTGIAINPTGSIAYIADSGTNSVSVITTDLSVVTSTTSLPVATNVSGNYAGFLGANAVAYLPGVQSGNGIISVLSTPSLVAPLITLNSQNSDIRVGTGPTSVAVNAHGSSIVTSSGNIQATGGTVGTELQYATRNNLTISGPQSALSIDFHALDGVFTNNSTISVSGGILFVASPAMFNNGAIDNTNAAGSIGLQSPSGVLKIVMGSGSQISASATAGTIAINPALGFSVDISGGPAKGILNAKDVRIFGNLGQSVNVNVMQVTGKVSTTDDAGSVTLISAIGNLEIGDISTSSIAGTAGPIFIKDAGDLTVAGNVIASGISGGRIDLYSSMTTIDSSFKIEANGTSASGGKIQFAPSPDKRVLAVVNNGTISATNVSENAGIVGFNCGNDGTLSVTASTAGIINAGQFANFGNLNSSTLMIKSIFTIVGIFTPTMPFTGSYSQGKISISGNSISGTIQVTGKP